MEKVLDRVLMWCDIRRYVSEKSFISVRNVVYVLVRVELGVYI